jgi:hypothetical protein
MAQFPDVQQAASAVQEIQRVIQLAAILKKK